jgi:hypothetical protein
MRKLGAGQSYRGLKASNEDEHDESAYWLEERLRFVPDQVWGISTTHAEFLPDTV